MLTNFQARIVSIAGAGIFFALPSTAQLGHVVSAQKISDTAGGFTAPLDEEDQFGRSIVRLGDLDGDGVTDLMVGAHTDDDGGVDKGSVYVLFMHANGFVKSWSKISDLSGNFGGRLRPGDQFGRAAACIGDLDLDGVVDVVVSSNYDDDGGTNKGAVYVLFLNADGTVKASQKISSTQGGLPAPLKLHDEFGRSITCLGDLDGDGIPDIVVGTPEDDDGGTNTGALHVLFLKRDGTVKAYKRISRSTDALAGLKLKPGDWFGHCSANLGDFDHDGVVDLVVGSVLDDDGGLNQGSVWILYLRADGSVKEAHEINELLGGFTAVLDDVDQFGTSVANLGDLDGDGVTDIAVGAVKDDDGGNDGNPDADVGAVYVLFLEADATVKSWVKISDTSGDLPYGLDQYDWFGSALCPLGGSPGDGLFNLAIGCRNDDDGSPNRGAIYLVQLNDGTAPVASFTPSRTRGVAPLTVTFADASSGEITAWLWSLGEGSPSTLPSPTRTYAVPGVYDVQLTVRGPKGRDVELRRSLITVLAGPLADFTAEPTSGLAPLSVAFTDRSEGQVTGWSWDFGDGSHSVERSPTHVYAAGTYDVSLKVTGPGGTDTRVRSALVEAVDLAPDARFGADVRAGLAPLTVQFTDLSTGAVTARTWDFGDGTTGTGSAPQHVYATPGTYTVGLTAQGPYGSDVETLVDAIVVIDPVPSAAFSVTPAAGDAPLEVAFQDLSTGDVSARLWTFGDGSSSSARDPQHVYGDPGLYTVSLSVWGPHGGDVETRVGCVTVVEPPPAAEFQANTTRGFAPLQVEFTDQSSGIVTSWVWDFGDGSGGIDAQPEHLYTLPGLYTVRLSVSGPSGSDTLSRTAFIRVEDPVPAAHLDADPTAGVVPLTVEFQDASLGEVTAWSWDFGDGQGSLERDPVHVYTAPGVYDVRLLVSGPRGASEELRAGLVEVRDPAPEADIGAEPTLGFAPLAVSFQDLSSGPVAARTWDFGDGTSSSLATPTHVYMQPGSYTVRLALSGPGGEDEKTWNELITVLDPVPVAAFTHSLPTGVAPFAVQFTDASSGLVTAWSWSFGDGQTSSERSPAHVYANPGTYTVVLTVSGPNGTDLEERQGLVQVQWPAPAAEFTAGPVSGPAPLPVAFTDLTVGNATAWFWTFGDGTRSRARHPVKVYNRAGDYTVTLLVKGPGGTSTVIHGGISVWAPPVLEDGGFELDTLGQAPRAPWTHAGGEALAVCSSATPDGGFPSEGVLWCEVSSEGSVAATPPSNPGGAGDAPAGAVVLARPVPYSPLAPHLVFDASFLCGEDPGAQATNDFMSVELSDGTTSVNLFHADTGSSFPSLSSRRGLPMTPRQRVVAHLASLFPGLAPGSVLTLRISLGNGGDGARPSYGYVDAVRLVPSASVSVRNGTGRNALRYQSSPAVLGGTWTIQVDTTGHVGARTIQLLGTQRPASGVQRASGELLVSGKKVLAYSWPALPGLNVHTIQLPPDLALLGTFVATQVTITGGQAELCNANDLVLGF